MSIGHEGGSIIVGCSGSGGLAAASKEGRKPRELC